ncbi:MAG: hypothetical protein PsegKO_33190 [Pseudohongiellaceae bacterium]
MSDYEHRLKEKQFLSVDDGIAALEKLVADTTAESLNVEKFLNALNGSVSVSEDAFRNVNDRIAHLTTKLSVAEREVTEASNALRETLTSVESGLEKMAQVASDTNQDFDDFISKVREKSEEIEAKGAIVADLDSSICEDLVKVKTSVKRMQDAANGGQQKISGCIAEMADEVKQQSADFEDYVGDLTQSIVDFCSSFTEYSDEFASAVEETIRESISKLLEKWSLTGEQKIKDVHACIDELFETKLRPEIKAVIADLYKQVQAAEDSLKIALDGSEGSLETSKQITEALKEPMDALDDAIKTVLG